VRYTVPDDAIEVRVVCDNEGLVRLGVSDSGSGIADEDLAYVFDRFRTGGIGAVRGTGLGLALVRAVAHAHGGSATVRSTLGQGSDLEILLPAVTSDPSVT
jgi:signal transduction histidine kinase